MGSLTDLQNRTRTLEQKVKDLERQLLLKDEQIADLRSQLDKYQSVVHSPASLSVVSTSSAAGGPRKQRAQGISAEPQAPSTLQEVNDKETFKTYQKSQRSRDLIRQAIETDEFLKHLSETNIREIIDCMYMVEFKKDTMIIKEGDVGSRVYVLEEGKVEVTKESQKLCTLSSGKVFGELAILYNCTRTASVKAMVSCKLWTIERHVFQAIMMKGELLRRQQQVDLLKCLPKLKNTPDELINKLADALEEVHYESGDFISKQGTKIDAVFIISKGKVKETKRPQGAKEDAVVRTLSTGDFFGEKALEKQEIHTTNFLAADKDGVVCLLLDREVYMHLTSIDDGSAAKNGLPRLDLQKSNLTGTQDGLKNVRLADFVVITTIGVGGFGRVEMVQLKGDNSKSYALKVMKKIHVVETKQQEHIMNEKNIMSDANSDFIVRLYSTFKDSKYVYMLLDICLGGELWTLLRDKSSFDEPATRFYSACVVEAFSYLHSHGIVYRDLKPENLLLDSNGYVKLVDFGFAKRIGQGRKTWTFCGTPEYVAPEIVMNKGHDTSADLWSLGILIFELLTGSPPFSASDPMKTYNLILKGFGGIEFPKKISKNAQNIVKKFCKNDPVERLGFGPNGFKEINKHKWFEGFVWDALRKRTTKAPFLPKVKGPTDSSNFDSYPADEGGVPPDDYTGWDRDF